MPDVHEPHEQLIRELLSKPDEITAILQSNAHQLTPDFFYFLGGLANYLKSNQRFQSAADLANLGIKAATFAGAKHDAYRLVELVGRIEMDQNHLEDAIKAFETARTMAKELLDAGDNEALIGFVSNSLLIADQEAARENYARAREILAEARLTSNKLHSAWGELWTIVNLAAICLKQGDYEQALTYASLWTDVLQRLSAGKSSNSVDADAGLPPQSRLYDLLANLARMFYYERDDYKSASIAAKQAVQLDPAREDAYPLLGFCQLRLQQFAEAVETWKKLVGLDPNKPFHQLNYSLALQTAGRLEEALGPAGEAIRLVPSSQRYYLHRSRILTELERYEEAISDYKHIIELFETGTHEPDPAPVQNPRSRAEWERNLPAQELARLAVAGLGYAYRKVSKFEDARQISMKLINDNDETIKVMGYYQLGELESFLGNKTDALRAYSKSLELDQDNKPARIERVEIYISQNELENAVSDLSILARQDQAPTLAIEKLTAILDKNPDCHQARKWLGFAYLQSFRPSKAHENLNLAIEHLPDDAELYLWRGLTKIMTGLTDEEQEWDKAFTYQRLWESIEDLGNAVRLAPENVQAVDSYKWLVDRVTAAPEVLFRISFTGSEPNGLYTLFPNVREPLNHFWSSGNLAAARQWGKAVEELKLAQSGFEAAGFPAFAARIDMNLADNYLRLYNLQEALDHITRAEQYFSILTQPLTANLRDIAKQTSEKARQRSFSQTANVELDFMNVYGIGFDLLWKTVKLIKAETLSRLNDVGGAIEALGDVNEFTADVEKTLKSGISYQALMAIVMIFRDAGQFDKAIETFRKIETFAPTDKEKIVLYNTGGTLFEIAGDYDEGMSYFKKTHDMLVQMEGGKEYLPVILMNMAANHAHQNRPQEALDCLESVDIARDARSLKETYSYYIVMAQALTKLKRNKEAQDAILKALAIIEEARHNLRSFGNRMSWQSEQEDTYRLAVKIAVMNNDQLVAFELIERARARAFVDQLATGHLALPESEKQLEEIEKRILEQYALLSRLLNSLETAPDFIDYEVVGKLVDLHEEIKLFEDEAGTRLSREKIEEEISQLTQALKRLRDRMEEAQLLNAMNTYGAMLSFPELRQLLSN